MKNRILPILGIAGLLSAPAASAGLVAHYTFDDPTSDATMGANTGSATTSWNGFTGVTATTGKFGGAGDFNGASAWDGSFGVGADLSNFSISLHVKGGDHAWKDYVSIGTGNNVVHVLEQTGAGGLANYNINNVGGDAGTAGVSNDVDITDGQWHHIGMTVSGGVATLYVDGVNRVSGAYTGSGAISVFQLASRFGDGARAINAELDDVAVYDLALSDGQMAHLTNNVATDNPVPEPGSLALLGLGGLLIARRRRS